ncbi:MAG: hypothetical protein AAB323_01490 [Pseudomonadota bacterium]
MDHFTQISSHGTIQIPPSMLKDLGFEPGMSIQLHKTSDDCLKLRPLRKTGSIERLFGLGKGHTSGIVDVDASIIQAGF